MGDLAVALVELGSAAGERRQARQQLRKAVEAVVPEIVRHLREGDWVLIYDNPDSAFPVTQYMCETVTWDVDDPDGFTQQHPKGLKTLTASFCVDETHYTDDSVVLYDVRSDWVDKQGRTCPPIGRDLVRTNTDLFAKGARPFVGYADEVALLRFAKHAPEVVRLFAERLEDDTESMGAAADSLVRMIPR